MSAADLELSRYLERIGHRGPVNVDYATLAALHLGHATHIPFENLDVLTGQPIRLDLASLQAKLVAGRRGGYCFEQNLLFAAILRRIGFAVRPLAGRVRYRTTRVLPRTHMLLLVAVEGREWLADVGFGGEGLLHPVPFGEGAEAAQFAWTYRIVPEGAQWVLQSRRDGAWMDLYAFTLEEQTLPDFEMANYYVSHHPDSRFVQTLTAQLPTPAGRHILIDREYLFDDGRDETRRTLSRDEDLRDLLFSVFGLTVPAGFAFPI